MKNSASGAGRPKTSLRRHFAPEVGHTVLAETLLSRLMGRAMRRILAFEPAPPAGPGTLPPSGDGRARLLYLHIPFCRTLCPYCSFNRVQLDVPLARRYFRSLKREARLYRERGHRFDSVYVGGGTPTILPEELGSVLELVRDLWPIRRISVETNPDFLTPRGTRFLQGLGVQRLSVGVQSFNDQVLQSIERYRPHGSGREIRERLAAAAGLFETLNIDLIFNYPFQTEAMLCQDLETVRDLGIDQVTFYPLMAARAIRRKLAKWGKSRLRTEKRFYRRIWGELIDAYRPASAWCFSRRRNGDLPPRGERALLDEYIIDREEYAGLGSGAFGYIGGLLYANTFDVLHYTEMLERGSLPVAMARRFSPRERVLYDCLMKLFDGRLDLEELEGRYGRPVWPDIRGEVRLLRLIRALRWDGGRPAGKRALELTAEGYYFWVLLMREFFTAVNELRERCMAAGRGPAAAGGIC